MMMSFVVVRMRENAAAGAEVPGCDITFWGQ
jgi:hypothetical protein